MKALVYHGPGLRAWEEVPDPVIELPTNIVVRVETSTISSYAAFSASSRRPVLRSS